jgi:hypothetical protein
MTFLVDSRGKIKNILNGVNLDTNGQPKTYTEIIEAIQKLD